MEHTMSQSSRTRTFTDSRKGMHFPKSAVDLLVQVSYEVGPRSGVMASLYAELPVNDSSTGSTPSPSPTPTPAQPTPATPTPQSSSTTPPPVPPVPAPEAAAASTPEPTAATAVQDQPAPAAKAKKSGGKRTAIKERVRAAATGATGLVSKPATSTQS